MLLTFFQAFRHSLGMKKVTNTVKILNLASAFVFGQLEVILWAESEFSHIIGTLGQDIKIFEVK